MNRQSDLAIEPWWQSALDFVFPPRCVHCGRRGAEVCAGCVDGAPPIGPEVCPRCSLPSIEGRICHRCAGREHVVRAVIAGGAYRGVTRSAILAFKYRRRTRLERFLSGMLASALETRPLTIDIVVPVPLAHARLDERGFNQAHRLAVPIAAAHHWTVDSTSLIRVRDTARQVGLSAIERRRNVLGAFELLEPANFEGQRVLLVDDVCTTGATLDACAAPILKAGAEGVWAAVVARDVFAASR